MISGRFWRRATDEPALYAGGILVLLNIVAFSPVWRPTGETLGAANALTAALLAFLVKLVESRKVGRVLKSYSEWLRQGGPYEIVGAIVGREGICEEIECELRDRKSRNPQLLLGGVGAGKTSVLILLTENLARRGLLPVPVQLGGSDSTLDFLELAHRRFLAATVELPEDDRERAWRRLVEDDKVVVLADDLQEALGSVGALGRESVVRSALQRARWQRLPLVVTSLPHGPLFRAIDVTVTELEPLDEGEVATLLHMSDWHHERLQGEWLVRTAQMAEAPFYLRLTGELIRSGLLESGTFEFAEGPWRDRSRVRVSLWKTWESALVRRLHPEVALSEAERWAALEWLSVYACIGLRDDTVAVPLDSLDMASEVDVPIIGEVLRRLRVQGAENIDAPMGAAYAEALGLVEIQGASVRFRNSLLQAYFGSRLMDVATRDSLYMASALRCPSRELLISLVLHSRAVALRATREDPAAPPHDFHVVELLRVAARGRADARGLDVWVTAVEIDNVSGGSQLAVIAQEIAVMWPDIRSSLRENVEVNKLEFVRRFGEALRATEPSEQTCGQRARQGYRLLWSISGRDNLASVRLAASREIADGGNVARAALDSVLGSTCRAACGQRRENRGGRSADSPLRRRAASAERERRSDEEHRARTVSAWLAPSLAGSVVGRGGDSEAQTVMLRAREDLMQWLVHGQDLRMTEEIALAQGFKYAANRRLRHPRTSRETKEYLMERALQMLAGAAHWFSQVTLIQALALWALPDDLESHGMDRRAAEETVNDWTRRIPTQLLHPFVREAAELAVRALEIGQPTRFIWLDERETLSRVGSAQAPALLLSDVWLPVSTGWKALDRRAQQLMADVVLLLNLTEREGRPAEIESRLSGTLGHHLPPCLTSDRSPLLPDLPAVGELPLAGSTCLRSCQFSLCPYPSPGMLPRQAELPAAFCRTQRTSLSRAGAVRRHAAPWQRMTRWELRRFWDVMRARALRG
ncbi:ATP-binding protein [Streptomyces sp. NPDC046915]|uniref:ATP-binding protein n=1 Tax=Streptomyces sp. NPDC046915 TaxID=3155257 RepID=UPI003405EB7F